VLSWVGISGKRSALFDSGLTPSETGTVFARIQYEGGGYGFD